MESPMAKGGSRYITVIAVVLVSIVAAVCNYQFPDFFLNKKKRKNQIANKP